MNGNVNNDLVSWGAETVVSTGACTVMAVLLVLLFFAYNSSNTINSNHTPDRISAAAPELPATEPEPADGTAPSAIVPASSTNTAAMETARVAPTIIVPTIQTAPKQEPTKVVTPALVVIEHNKDILQSDERESIATATATNSTVQISAMDSDNSTGKNNNWRCACENGFLPPSLLKTFGGAEAIMRLGTGQCYHKQIRRIGSMDVCDMCDESSGRGPIYV